MKSLLVVRPKVTKKKVQHFCADKGYDAKVVREMIAAMGYILHIKSRGEEKKEKVKNPEYKPRRWVAERGFGWLNRFRALLIRWSKKAANFEAELHFGCSWIAFRAAGVLG
jgi:putative transposase